MMHCAFAYSRSSTNTHCTIALFHLRNLDILSSNNFSTPASYLTQSSILLSASRRSFISLSSLSINNTRLHFVVEALYVRIPSSAGHGLYTFYVSRNLSTPLIPSAGFLQCAQLLNQPQRSPVIPYR